MKQKITFIFLAVLCAFQTVLIGQNSNAANLNAVELGAIISQKKTLLSNHTSITALPRYQENIRVQYILSNFDKNTFKKYSTLAQKQGKKINVEYIDSIKTKPQYVNFQLLDKVQLIHELNGQHNNDVLDFLQNTKNHQLVMGVSTYLMPAQINLLKQADELYLTNGKVQKYSISLIKNGTEIGQLDLTKNVIFNYESGGFCWKKERGKFILANINSKGESCIKGTHQNIAKLNKKEDYYKF